MENSQVKSRFVHANFSTMKYVSLIGIGFMLYFLITDFFFPQLLKSDLVFTYRTLDLIFTGIVLFAITFIWLVKLNSIALKNLVSLTVPFLLLNWAALTTAIDFQVFGLSTYLIILMFCTFYLYLDLKRSILFFASSVITFFTTLIINHKINDNLFPMLFLLIPVIFFAIFVSVRNYRNKSTDLLHQEQIAQMNQQLVNANENLEKEVEKRTKEILKALAKAEESDRLKSSFLRNISHEIRTPLNGVAGFSQLITKPNLPQEKLERYAESIKVSSERIIRIVTDVIEISHIEAEQVEVKMSEFDFINLITPILKKYETLATEKNIGFRYKSNLFDNECNIITDRRKLETIFTHVIDNAVKFTIRGSVEIQTNFEKDKLNITVSDTGIGIADETRDAIFEPFRQAETGICRNFGGNGLGLAIIKAYVDILEGKISFTSKLQVGTEFLLSIPIERIEHKLAKNFTSKLEITKNTILIAEDEHNNYEYLLELLEKTKVKHLHVINGQQAVDLCKSTNTVSLIFMDIKMPIMDGYTAAKQIKANHPEIIIIAQTAYALENEKEQFAGVFDDYIIKPIDEDELYKILTKYFV